MESEELVKRMEEYKNKMYALLDTKAIPISEINSENEDYNVEGVYLLIDEADKIIYAGKTNHKKISDRVGKQHVYGGAPSDLRWMFCNDPLKRLTTLEEAKKYKCKFVELKGKRDRAMFEHFIISILQPEYNKPFKTEEKF